MWHRLLIGRYLSPCQPMGGTMQAVACLAVRESSDAHQGGGGVWVVCFTAAVALIAGCDIVAVQECKHTRHVQPFLLEIFLVLFNGSFFSHLCITER